MYPLDSAPAATQVERPKRLSKHALTASPSQQIIPDPAYSTTLSAPGAKTAVSRDEMNLAEFPVSMLSTRSDRSVKTLEFRDSVRGKNGEVIKREWVITGADKFGLPTASDDEVLLGLLKLTVDQAFTSSKVFFTRYELLKILRWTTEGRSYSRLQNAFDRLSGVRIKATNAFFDNETKSHSTKNFGIIDAYEMNDGRDTQPKPSYFIWSEEIFKSFQAGFIKKIDLDFYLNLKSAISKRLYRFLDKHFWYKSRVKINLFVLAHEKVGISRNYKYVSSLRQQLDGAADELIKCGFLAGYDYEGQGSGTEIQFYAAAGQPRSTQKLEQPQAPFEKMALEKSVSQRSNTQQALSFGAVKVERAPTQPYAAPVNHVIAPQELALEENPQRSPQYNPQGNLQCSAEHADFEQQRAELLQLLVQRGLQEPQTRRLMAGKSPAAFEKIGKIIAHYDQLLDAGSVLISRNPQGFLFRAVERSDTFLLPEERQTQATVSKAAYLKPPTLSTISNTISNVAQRNVVQDTRRQVAAGLEQAERVQKQYEIFRRQEIERLRSELEPALYETLVKDSHTQLAKMAGTISPERFEAAVQHQVDQRVAQLFVIEEFEEWRTRVGH